MLSHDNIGGKLLPKIAPAQAPPGDDFHIRVKPSTIFIRDLTLAVTQLRAAYAQLSIDSVTDQKKFADDFISPQIERIENTLRRLR